MRINVSWLLEHLNCPQRAVYRHENGRILAVEGPALTVGTLWHTLMASWWLDRDMAEALRKVDVAETLYWLTTADPAKLTDYAKKQRSEWHDLKQWAKLSYPAWVDHYLPDTKCTGTEIEMSMPLGEDVIVCRLDGMLEHPGFSTILQHKTTRLASFESLFKLHKSHWYECIYQAVAEYNGHSPAGTTFIVVNKAAKVGSRLIEQRHLVHSRADIEAAKLHVATLIADIKAQRAGTRPIVRNRAACVGIYGECPYLDVCSGHVDISDNRFTDATSTYEDIGHGRHR